MAKQELTCDDILKELRAKQYRPVYYLMGEESYYIDLIADYITDNVLSETEKEFNLTVVYVHVTMYPFPLIYPFSFLSAPKTLGGCESGGRRHLRRN